MPSGPIMDSDRHAPKGRSTLEKILLFVVLLNMAALIVMAVFVSTKDDVMVTCAFPDAPAPGKNSFLAQSTSPPGPVADTARDVCTTPECVTAASNLIKSIDASVSPCDDFYQFACGGWESRHKIPEAQSRFSTFTLIAESIDSTLKALLEAPSTPNEKDYIKKAKDFYASCMNMELINNQSSQPVVKLINDLGGWPLVTKSWTPTNFSLTELLLKVSRYNLLPLLQLYSATDILEPSKVNLHLDQTDLGLPGPKYYNASVAGNAKYIKAYKDFMQGVAELIGLANSTTAMADINRVVDFETELAEIIVPDEARRDPRAMNNPQKLEDINRNNSVQGVLNITKYTLDMMAMDGIGFHDITEEEIIINEAPAYFSKLKNILSKKSARTLANYVVWRSVKDNIGMLGSEFRDLFTDYRKVVYGLTSDYARDALCLNYVNREMGFAAGRLFLDASFSSLARSTADDMVDHLKAAFNEHLLELDWMDAKTRDLAKNKNDHITRRIGYPNSNKNDTFLSQMYANTAISRDSFFQNVLNTQHRSFVDDASRFRKPTDKTRWSDPPQTVNAYYSPDKNQITFPAGILQPPFFNANFPKYLNYGGMGMVIGHEITHGFDDQGRLFDLDGKLENWWTNDTSTRYNAKAQCIIKQYSQFSKNIGGKDYHLNGVTTQGENIADNGGIKISYKAYKTWEATLAKPEPSLPGLNYTNDQLFFINFGQSFCGLARDEHVIELIRTDPHPPGVFRIRGVAQNMPNFADVFNCAAGSNMNPVDKCSVW